MTELLSVQNVSKSFGRVRAVDDVSFSVRDNEIFGIAGPNGAGKTTLFNAISGIPFHPDAGKVIFEGVEIQSKPAHEIARLGLTRTFQRETVFESLTVMENVQIGLAYGKSVAGHAFSEPVDVLETLELDHVQDEVADNLSLFNKKKLMFASALVMQPKIIMLDEPAAGLTQIEIQKMIALIETINQQGVTIILIEHVLPLLLALSQQIMILDYGKKLVQGDPNTVVKDERVIEAYLGKRGTDE